jgi:hypothetical protein
MADGDTREFESKGDDRRRAGMANRRSSDPWAVIVIILTVGLFVLALFLKGFSHDVLLEAGVFLVSLKLILMAKKNAEVENRLEDHLIEIKRLLASQTWGGLESNSEW